MDDIRLHEKNMRRERNNRGSMSMMNLSMGHESKTPGERRNLPRNDNYDNRQRIYPSENNRRQQHGEFIPQNYPYREQHGVFPRGHQGKNERSGSHNPGSYHPNNRYSNNDSRPPYSHDHYREYEDGFPRGQPGGRERFGTHNPDTYHPNRNDHYSTDNSRPPYRHDQYYQQQEFFPRGQHGEPKRSNIHDQNFYPDRNNHYSDYGSRPPYSQNTFRGYRNASESEQRQNLGQHMTHRYPSGKEYNAPPIVNILIGALSRSNSLSDTAENVGWYFRIPPPIVMREAQSRKDIFTVNHRNNDSIIRLDPKLALCLQHYSSDGCSLPNCKDLHVCRKYIQGNDKCKSNEPCLHGHELKTNHNYPVLSSLHLDMLSNEDLLKVLRRSCKYVDTLEICWHYNSDKGCKYDERCYKLHICKNVVDRNECSECSLNHDILARQCRKVLEHYGVHTNETPRDILIQVRMLSELANNSSTKDNDQNSPENSDVAKTGKTHQSTDIYGDDEIEEICIYSREKNCKDFQKGCKYLHSNHLFQWQVKENGVWYNIPIIQSTRLENAFCDVSECTARIPGLIKSWKKELIEVLGTSPWKADFTDMTMTDPNDKKLDIRRLSTPSASIVDNANATVFQWYFRDDNDKWIQYGDVDSFNKKQMISSITSKDIEKQFLVNKKGTISFHNSEFKYSIDFSRMIQLNESTRKERDVRRRPSGQPVKSEPSAEEKQDPKESKRTSFPGAKEKKEPQDSKRTGVPSHWDAMTDGLIHKLVDLDSSSDEYFDVSQKISITLPTAKIQTVQRLQNPHLWDSFQFKKKSLIQRNGEGQLHVNQLFYGMNSEELLGICNENIDWRRRETCNKNYGLGTYFSNSAAVACKHCTKDNDGFCCLILTSVIIGKIVKGDGSFTRPPFDSSTNTYYDTAVDDEDAPTLFVKFENNEYYPCYIIKLSTSK